MSGIFWSIPLTMFMLGVIKAVLLTFEGEPWAPWSSPPASPRSCLPGEEEGEVAPLDREPPCPAGLPSHLLPLKHLAGGLVSPSWSPSPSSLPHSLPPTRLITLSHILASLLSGQSETINAMTDQEISTGIKPILYLKLTRDRPEWYFLQKNYSRIGCCCQERISQTTLKDLHDPKGP